VIKIAFVGKKASGKTFSAFYLSTQYGFKKIRMDDGVSKAMRFFYMYGKHARPSWERKLDIYDALYKIDPTIHINYMLRRLERTTSDVVIEDARYISELQVLKEHGFVIVRIAAPADRLRKISGSVRNAAAGTIVLQEYFNEDKTAGYSTDFSIYNNTREGTRKSLDHLVDTLRNKDV
jgi:hypothetical protein